DRDDGDDHEQLDQSEPLSNTHRAMGAHGESPPRREHLAGEVRRAKNSLRVRQQISGLAMLSGLEPYPLVFQFESQEGCFFVIESKADDPMKAGGPDPGTGRTVGLHGDTTGRIEISVLQCSEGDREVFLPGRKSEGHGAEPTAVVGGGTDAADPR